MSPDEAWNNILSKLSQLLENQAFSTFHPFLEKLRQWSSAKQYTPEVYQGFIEIFQKMNVDIQAGRPVTDLLRQVSTGGYVQPEWDVHSVYQTNGHIFQIIFGKFLNEIGSSRSQSIEVPVVLLVMDMAEAEELVSLSAFQGYPAKLRNDFKRLKKRLDKEIPDWQKRYWDSPELWQPFSSAQGGISIKSFIIQALNIAKNIYEERHGQAVSFSPFFRDIRTINNDRAFLKRLRRDGCVIIMDIISMCHPVILRSFQKSLLDAYPDTFVMTFAPTYQILKEVREMTVSVELRISDMEFAKRKHDACEKGQYGACAEIHEEELFHGWLNSWIPESIDRKYSNQSKKGQGIQPYINNFSESDGGNA